jgi:hypothetical protein
MGHVKKLDNKAACIETVSGVGYRFRNRSG